MVSYCIGVAHDRASLLLKTGRYRETIAPDDLDTCIKTIRSPNVTMQLPSFSFVCYTNPCTWQDAWLRPCDPRKCTRWPCAGSLQARQRAVGRARPCPQRPRAPWVPALFPHASVLCGWASLEHVLNDPADRRDRTGFAQPWAATLFEERPAARAPSIAREKNDPLAQGRILLRQEGVEGGPVQVGHMQVTYNHVVAPLVEQGEGPLAIGRRLDVVAIPAQELGQRADDARLIINHENCPSDRRGHMPSLCTRSRETLH